MPRMLSVLIVAIAVGCTFPVRMHAAEYASHPPQRPLPEVANRPLTKDPVFFVHPESGSDSNPGSLTQPWRTLTHAVGHLQPGQTLVLRGGVYHEPLHIEARGTAQAPITIRSHPGELAIIDGGIPEFLLTPSTAWEPLENGEFRSARTYPGLGGRPDVTHLLGNFADSMVPLHGYRFITDLRSDNHKFPKLEGPKTAQGNGLYCGPGLFYDSETERIHIRLAPTKQPSIGEQNNYRGETDPRNVPLIVAGGEQSPVELREAAHIVLQDLVVRGSRQATISVVGCSNITLDSVVSYGGSAALRVDRTSGLRCVNSAFRGIAAPWLWRWSLKYRSIEARIVSASRWNPPARGNRDFEFAWCEFTDSVDGVFIGNVDGVVVHHCLLDNVSDDGFFITCRTAYDGSTPGGDFRFHHNRISRVLSAFAFGVGHGRQKTINAQGDKQLGVPTVIRQNVFDLREPVLYQQPVSGPILTFGRVAGDHGGPAWEALQFVENTVLSREAPWRGYYGAGWGKAMHRGTSREISRNVFRHQSGLPGEVLPADAVKFKATDNVHWSDELGESARETFLKRFRASAMFEKTGWTQGDIYANPDKLPEGLGAGHDEPVGVRGRVTMYGKQHRGAVAQRLEPFKHPVRNLDGVPVALVQGYPAFDGPILQYALEKAGADVDVFDREWLPVDEFGKYRCVAILGSTVRAKMTPSGFANQDHAALQAYLEQGGTVIIGRELHWQLFPGAEGRSFLERMTGTGPAANDLQLQVLQPEHAWLSGLDRSALVASKGVAAVPWSRGINVIGSRQAQRSILAEVRVGNGRLIYVGWDIARYLPNGRKPSTPEEEALYEQHYQIYERIAQQLML